MQTPEFSSPRDALLAAFLPHAGFDGWSQTSLAVACRDLGWPDSEVLRLFPGGPAQLADYHNAQAVASMVEALGKRDLAGLKIREKVALGVRLMLEPQITHREALRRALPLLAMPRHLDIAARTAWRVADAIWYALGDASTDFNFYSKRGLLVGVWSTTLLYWLDDRSVGCAKSWAFLDRRIDNVMQIEKLKSRLGLGAQGPRKTKPDQASPSS